MEIINVNISDLKTSEYNPRKATKKELADIRASLEEFGTVQPAVVNSYPGRENVIIGGHQRIDQAKTLGWEKYPCVYVALPLDQEKRLNLKLNKLQASWDAHLLATHFDTAMLMDCGFSQFDLNLKMSAISHTMAPPPIIATEAPEADLSFETPGDALDAAQFAESIMQDTRPKFQAPTHRPLAIVLSADEFAEWERAKEKIGAPTDRAAVLSLIRALQ